MMPLPPFAFNYIFIISLKSLQRLSFLVSDHHSLKIKKNGASLSLQSGVKRGKFASNINLTLEGQTNKRDKQIKL